MTAVDNNPFGCNNVLVSPFGPFSSRARSYNLCPSNTYGPVKDIVLFEIDSERENLKYRQAMTTIKSIGTILEVGFNMYQAVIDSRQESKQKAHDYCVRSQIAPSPTSSQDSVACGRLLRIWSKRTREDFLTRKVKYASSSEAGTSFAENFFGPFSSWADEITPYTVARSAEYLLFNTVPDWLERIKEYRALVADKEYLGDVGKASMYDCKYASSIVHLGLYVCNFNNPDGVITGNDNIQRQCFVPLGGYSPSPQQTERAIIVYNGILIKINNNLDLSGLIYVRDFIGYLGNFMSKKHLSTANDAFSHIELSLSIDTINITCTRIENNKYYVSGSSGEQLEFEGVVLRCVLPSIIKPPYNSMFDDALQNANLPDTINITNHLLGVDSACHSLVTP